MKILQRLNRRTRLALCCVATSTACVPQPPPTCRVEGSYWLTLTAPSGPVERETMAFDQFPAAPGAGADFAIVYTGSAVAGISGRADLRGEEPYGNARLPFDSVHGVCSASAFSASRRSVGPVLADVDAGISAEPATEVSYLWNQLDVFVAPYSLGNLARGELVRTIDGTATTFAVIGLAPERRCEVDEDCKPFQNPDGGRPTSKSQIPSELSIDGSGELLLRCEGGGLDMDMQPTGHCELDLTKRTFEQFVKLGR